MDSNNSSSQFVILYLCEKGPMGNAPYSGPRLGDGPIADIWSTTVAYIWACTVFACRVNSILNVHHQACHTAWLTLSLCSLSFSMFHADKLGRAWEASLLFVGSEATTRIQSTFNILYPHERGLTPHFGLNFLPWSKSLWNTHALSLLSGHGYNLKQYVIDRFSWCWNAAQD